MKKLFYLCLLVFGLTACQSSGSLERVDGHPRLYVSDGDYAAVVDKIATDPWAATSFDKMTSSLAALVERHKTDPEWITSRLSMYWKEGERYTQCYLLKQNWDRGEGDAPVPTLRFPGMRTWNKYYNVALEDRIPYNESGDMLGIDRTDPTAPPTLVPYKESGHMVRLNNSEILDLARDAAYIYWVTKDESYAKFAADIYYTWLVGIYYMNPILDPTNSTNGPGGWAPGGICGYYDYEQIHDDQGERVAAIYDYLYAYLKNNPNDHIASLGKTTKEVNDEVMKRFIDLGLVRGGKQGNWNVNGFARIMAPILVLGSNDEYADGKGREYYLEYFLTKTTDYHECLIDILSYYDTTTGLWGESPGYAFGIITSVLDFAAMLQPIGIDIIADNPILQKAAQAILPWMDERGNLVVFGDTRGGMADFTIFERLLTYYTNTGNTEDANKMAAILKQGVADGTYSRDNSNWIGLTTQVPLADSFPEVRMSDLSYSEYHRFFTMKDYEGDYKMMATIYGGRRGSHLSATGLSLTLYAYGYALAPDAAGYESYWSKDFHYHQSPTGTNTIMPGYAEGEIVVNKTFPEIAPDAFTNEGAHDSFYRMVDMSAAEKRRILSSVRCTSDAGYYVDIFMSDQADNDYIFHNVGTELTIQNKGGEAMSLRSSNDLGTKYSEAYSYFKNPRKVNYSSDFIAHWDLAEDITVDLRMLGGSSRNIYVVDAPYSTLSANLTPGGVSASPKDTPTLIVRQNGVNGKAQPFVGVYEAHKGSPVVKFVDKVSSSDDSLVFTVTLADGRVDTVSYSEASGVTISRK
ncbi:MAG: hypothetical protein R3Y55_01705 [Rikenellaceae bacterium]